MDKKDILVAEWVISHSNMCKVVKLLNGKKHSHRNYWFEVEDLGIDYRTANKEYYSDNIYDNYVTTYQAFKKPMVKMRVYRTVDQLKNAK